MSDSPVKSEEVAEQLRLLLAGEVDISCTGQTWDEWGDIEFNVGDWRMTFFNDCGELDYCDSVIAPDGRTSEYSDWSAENNSESWNNPEGRERSE